ncbi:hypothetical protein AX14_000263 [Amanita brunnescens Koide BX004]|nr:hypothetical protein AX14_000263 [Amanita brunnescens Koide BX004]
MSMGQCFCRTMTRPTFQCLSDEGAVLALPKDAIICEARNRANSQMRASHHALIYFITECTKSVDWGIAVYARSKVNHNMIEINRYNCRRAGPKPMRVLACYNIILRPNIWDKLKTGHLTSGSQTDLFDQSITRQFWPCHL